jgi:preprotein translocase subunit Sss1
MDQAHVQETKSATEQFVLGLLDDNDEAALVQLQKSHSTVFDTLKADATFLLTDAKRGSIFPFYRVDDRLEEEIDQLVITSEFLRFLMNRAMDAMKSKDILFKRDSQSSFDLFNVLRSIRKPQEKEYIKQDAPVELSGDPERDLINELGFLARRIAQHESSLRSLDDNASLPDPGVPPVKVEHVLRESIDFGVSQQSRTSGRA